jgi:hypothetical protein
MPADLAGRLVAQVDRRQVGVAVHGLDFGAKLDRDVRFGPKLLDQVLGHARLNRVAADDQRHEARVIGEMQRRLAGRVAGTNQIDIQAMGAAGLAAGRSIIDALADEPIEAVNGEPPPCHARCKDKSARPDRIGAVEKHLMRRWIDAGDGTCDQDLGAQPPGLLERAARQLVAGNAAWKAEIVLDPRRCPGLSARGLALDNDGAQTLGCAIDRRREAGRSAANDGNIVFPGARAGLEPQAIGKIAHVGSFDHLPVRQLCNGAVNGRTLQGGPKGLAIRRIGRQPVEGNLVARQKPAQITAFRVPAMPDQCDARLWRFRGDALQPGQSLAGQRADLLGHVLRDRRDGEVLLDFQPHHARWLGSPITPRKRSAKGDRHLAENGPRHPPAERALDPVECLDDFDLAREYSKERALSALMDCKFAGTQLNIGRYPRQTLQFG